MKRLLALLIVVALAAGGWFLWQRERGGEGAGAPQAENGPGGGRRAGGRRGGSEGPTSVLAEAARFADVPMTLVAVGTAQALNTVTVRSQIDGRLVEIAFREGQEVKKGDLIARIDPTIYQAQYDQALAKKAQDEAQLANARVDLARYVNLASTNYGSKQQADTQRAQVAQLEAQVKSDQGAIENVKAYLDYATIVSPLDGRTGIRLVDQGNIVKAADTTGLVVITQIHPISVLFNLPQQNLRAVNAASARGPLRVDALEADNQTALDQGTLEVVDNQVDQTTGTVKLKATFPNARQQLWPGQFVNVRLTVDTLRNAVVVPTAAVQRGPNGTFVYGIADDKAVLKPVTVGRQDETISVVTAGLTPPESVITTGFARLTEGDRVRVASPAQPSAAAADPGEVADTGALGADLPGAGVSREGRRPRTDNGIAATPEGGERRRRSRDGQAQAPAGQPPAGQPPVGQPPAGQGVSGAVQPGTSTDNQAAGPAIGAGAGPSTGTDPGRHRRSGQVRDGAATE